MKAVTRDINSTTSLVILRHQVLTLFYVAINSQYPTLDYRNSTLSPLVRKMASASDRVIGTYELLEKVLIATATDCPRSVFVVQRVCKAWQAIIRRSTTIRKLLFLLPDGQLAHPAISWQDDWASNDNPKFLYEQRLQFNDFAPPHFKHVLSGADDYAGIRVKILPGWACAYDPVEHDERASYREGFLTRPSVTHGILFVAEADSVRGGGPLSMTLFNPRGLTFGDLEDVATKVFVQRVTMPPKPVYLFCGFDVWDDGTYVAPKVYGYDLLDELFDGM